jgi:hypothetical protein
MAKYGLFGGGFKDPMQTFEAGKIAQNGDYVYAYKTSGNSKLEQVAAVKLGPGQVVKLIED